MPTVPATDFVRNFARYQDEAREEAVEITSHGRAASFLISPRDYEELMELRSKARRILKIGALPASIIDVLRTSQMSETHANLNSLLDE